MELRYVKLSRRLGLYSILLALAWTEIVTLTISAHLERHWTTFLSLSFSFLQSSQNREKLMTLAGKRNVTFDW